MRSSSLHGYSLKIVCIVLLTTALLVARGARADYCPSAPIVDILSDYYMEEAILWDCDAMEEYIPGVSDPNHCVGTAVRWNRDWCYTEFWCAARGYLPDGTPATTIWHSGRTWYDCRGCDGTTGYQLYDRHVVPLVATVACSDPPLTQFERCGWTPGPGDPADPPP